MTLTVTGYTISNDGSGSGEVRVRQEDHDIIVRWLCGDTRTFTKSDLKTIVEQIDAVVDIGEWLGLDDSLGDGFYVKVIDGQLFASDQPSNVLPWTAIDWTEIRKAIKKTAKGID